MAKEIVRTADPPDATPYGVGLVTRGGTMVYKGSKRLDVWSLDGRAPKKPRKFRVAGMGGIVAIAGFSFPARFQEFGTSHNPPQPFLGPAKNAVMGRVKSIMARTVKYRLARGRAA